MRVPKSSLALGAGCLSTLILSVNAVPSVNVELRTSFGAPPYLIELLETAAEENATSYFPVLDRIADGHFDQASTDQELYSRFRALLQEDGHLNSPESLTSFDLALSIHSAAPRIEAHYQYYNTSARPLLGEHAETGCETWVHVPFRGQAYCSPDLTESTAHQYGVPTHDLPAVAFDRILGDHQNGAPSVVYADITSKSFRKFHQTVSRTAKTGQTSYRVRYKPNAQRAHVPLAVSGYGVELALKRTDYIVIDDRQDEENAGDTPTNYGETTLSEEEVSDLRPLSSSELLRLGPKAANFVLASSSPLDTLAKLSQDFPKHSSLIAAANVSEEFLKEHAANREILLPGGFNVVWINGVQIMGRDMNAYSLLEHLRKERKMIDGVRELGLTAPEAIDMLAHDAITESQVSQQVQRYDWRDDIEGGNVILWLNDIEKDKRYSEWPKSLMALLQRVFPGQLPSVARDLHNVVVPIDFADYTDVEMIVESLQSFVKRKIPIRFGLVPRIRTEESARQAGVVYHLLDKYGLSPMLEYLAKSLASAGRKYGLVSGTVFQQTIESHKLRPGQAAQTLDEVASADDLEARLKAAQAYLNRIGGSASTEPPILTNGVAIQRSEDWLQVMSQRLATDLRAIQQAVYTETIADSDNVPELLFLASASTRRNPLIVPENDKDVRHINLGELPGFGDLPSLPADHDTIEREFIHLTVVVDVDSATGFELLLETLLFKQEHDNIEVALLHVPGGQVHDSDVHSLFSAANKNEASQQLQSLFERYESKMQAQSAINGGPLTFSDRRALYSELHAQVKQESTSRANDETSVRTWTDFKDIVAAVGVRPGQNSLVINGRVVGPVLADESLQVEDLEALLSYERKRRLLPAALAVQGLGLESRAASPQAFARISNLIALSTVSDVPEGIFEAAPTVRTGVFKQWNGTHTAIRSGDPKSATVQIFAAIDPASELAQRWIPILKVLSELDGVYLCMFLNPRERLEELPVKRFYRHVLSSKPSFAEDGAVKGLSAKFSGLPADALLNMGMDLPPSWLVAPEISVHDLDNIKLSAVRSGADIEAIYALENILIEGHSRDVTLGPAPRGAQLVLGTGKDTHVADTIVMSNLGYFQFKANPGVFDLALQQGRSEDIFRIDSAGTSGYEAQPGDNTTEIALISFRGATLFPRLSRKSGMEDEDVLEPSKGALENFADSADNLLAQAGLPRSAAGKYLSQAAKLGAKFFSGDRRANQLSEERHADINIFSVASGHLYERMLNIMMVSVMKHTNHSVKFWFIEQFLSPSFKDFVPILAAEYGFQYEMVTYKWPHWLRSQKEKQREIWGYKILFLDVLFPLDLDKVIFVDADQIVRTDMFELVQHDLKGAPYGFTPMCDSRTEMEGFRFWKQGYWKSYLRGLPYHISALYVVDLKKFRQIAAGDRLRQQYHQLSADPGSLSNLDQDLPNHMQMVLPIHSLPQEWLWCETWCSDEALKEAKTIDLCNNPQTKEPKLDRARRQVPEWTVYDEEIARVAKRHHDSLATIQPVTEGSAGTGSQSEGDEGIQERLQREDAEKERKQSIHEEL